MSNLVRTQKPPAKNAAALAASSLGAPSQKLNAAANKLCLCDMYVVSHISFSVQFEAKPRVVDSTLGISEAVVCGAAELCSARCFFILSTPSVRAGQNWKHG